MLPKTITSLCFIIVIYNKNYKLFNITHIVQYGGEHTGAEVTVFAEFFTPARSIQSGQRRRRYERFFHRNRARAPFAGRRKIIMGKKKKKSDQESARRLICVNLCGGLRVSRPPLPLTGLSTRLFIRGQTAVKSNRSGHWLDGGGGGGIDIDTGRGRASQN